MPLSFQEVPFLRLLLGWIIGATAYVYELDLLELIILIAAMIGFFLILWAVKKIERAHFLGILLIGLFIFLGFFRSFHMDQREMKSHFSNLEGELLFIAEIVESRERASSVALTVNVRSARNLSKQKDVFPIGGNLMLNVRNAIDSETYLPGRFIQFKSGFREVPPPSNPRAFSYRDFLARKRVYHQAFVDADEVKILNKEVAGFTERLHRFRKEFIGNLQRYTGRERTPGMITGIVLGDRSLLDSEINSAFRDVGAAHVLAVSGLHVGIVFSLFYLFLRRSNRYVQAGLVLTGVWAFVVFAGAPPSAVRAGSMFSIFTVGSLFGRRAHSINILAFCAFLHLFLEPNLMRDVGFQFSYLALGGIIVFFRKVNALFPDPGYVFSPVRDLVSLSIAAQLGVLPLSIYYFNQASPYFMLSSIFSVAGAYLILTGGLLTGMLGFIWPWMASWLGWLMDWLCQILAWLMIGFNQMPLSTLRDLYISPQMLVVIYLLIILTGLMWYGRFTHWRKPAIACFTLVFLTGFSCKLDSYNRHAVYIYSTGSEFLAEVYMPGGMLTVKSSDLNEKREDFASSGNRLYYRAKHREREKLILCKEKSAEWIKGPGFDIILVNGGLIPDPLAVQSDQLFIVFCQTEEIERGELEKLEAVENTNVVLTSSNSRSANRKIRDFAGSRNWPVSNNFRKYFSIKND